MPGSPFWTGASGTGPNSFDLVLSPDNNFLFTTDSFTQDITSFSIAENGELLPVTGSPFYTTSWEGGTAITGNGDYLYLVQFGSGKVDGQKVNPDGTLTPVPGTPFGPGNQNSLNGEVNSVITYPPPRCHRN